MSQLTMNLPFLPSGRDDGKAGARDGLSAAIAYRCCGDLWRFGGLLTVAAVTVHAPSLLMSCIDSGYFRFGLPDVTC